ncbi:MAG: hypothetical protein ABI480_02740, partial [Chitinophagaceae bacterium]
MNIYRRLLAYAKPYHKFVVPFFTFTLIGVFFGVFQFALIIPLLNFLFDPTNTADASRYATAPHFHMSFSFFKDLFYYQIYQFKIRNPVYALYFLAGLIVTSVICTNIFRYLAQRCLISARTMLVKRLREAMFEKI